jgi:hypothetical protein
MNPHLVIRRKAAHTLNALCKELKFGSKAEHFDGEDPANWTVYGDNLALATRGRVEVARVEILEGTKRHLTINAWSDLIRSEHLSDFDPSHYGLVVNGSADVLFQEKYPDSVGIVDFGEPIGLDMPPQPVMKQTRQRPPKVVM